MATAAAHESPGLVSSNRLTSNLEWQAWGERDPLFGVIPLDGRERDGVHPWTDADFYETGRSDWQELVERWRKFGLNTKSCLEIGCGAGRLTCHIARDFETVHGIDVAEGMIAYARNRMGANVELHIADGVTLPVPDQSLTAIFSVIVFLHFDRAEQAASYFREMARVLKPGGTVMIQLPVHSWPSNLKPVVRKCFAAAHSGYMALRRLKGAYHRFRLARGQWSPFMQSMSYDGDRLRETLQDFGFRDVETCSFQLTRGGATYSWVLARKA
jgi:ubiquinone/menaquinone biosynthesis C-methylase UbiE